MWLTIKKYGATSALMMILSACGGVSESPKESLSAPNQSITEKVLLPEPTPSSAPLEELTPSPTISSAPTKTPPPNRVSSTPTKAPTKAPTAAPTKAPTATPTVVPTKVPTKTPAPTATPTKAPTATPTAAPTKTPTATPTVAPTKTPTAVPTPDLAYGKAQYESGSLNCMLCHGKTGIEGFKPLIPFDSKCSTCSSLTRLSTYIAGNMPDKTGKCVGKCATSVAAYILNNFDDTAAPQLEDVDVGKTLYPLTLITASEWQQAIKSALVDVNQQDMAQIFSIKPAYQEMWEVSTAMTDAKMEDLMRGASKVADLVGSNPTAQNACFANGISAACVKTFITDKGLLLFKRPLSTEEVNRFAGFFTTESAKSNSVEGLKSIVKVLLLSPNFIYHNFSGDEKYGTHPKNASLLSLTPFEKCEKFSKVFYNGSSIRSCINTAATAVNQNRSFTAAEWNNVLNTSLSDNVVENHLAAYLSMISGITQMDTQNLPPEILSYWPMMVNQFNSFVKAEVLQKNAAGGIQALFTSSKYPINKNTNYFFNKNITSTTDTWVSLDSNLYRGMLGLPAYVVTDYSDVFKGLNMFESFLGVHLPSPEVDVVNERGEVAAKDRIVDEQCSGCHLKIDPIGFQLLRNFSDLGKPLTANEKSSREAEAPAVLKSGIIEVDGNINSFANLKDLSMIFATNPAVSCQFAKQYFAFAEGRRAVEVDKSSWQMMCTDFINSGGDFRVLPMSYLRTPAFNFVPTE